MSQYMFSQRSVTVCESSEGVCLHIQCLCTYCVCVSQGGSNGAGRRARGGWRQGGARGGGPGCGGASPESCPPGRPPSLPGAPVTPQEAFQDTQRPLSLRHGHQGYRAPHDRSDCHVISSLKSKAGEDLKLNIIISNLILICPCFSPYPVPAKFLLPLISVSFPLPLPLSLSSQHAVQQQPVMSDPRAGRTPAQPHVS